MKKFIAIAALVLSGCTSVTNYGACVGVADEKNPDLVYKLDAGNIIVAVLFSELIAPPIIVLADETFCPVARRESAKANAPAVP